MAIWTLHAAYDPDEHIWYTLDCDVPGLVTEGETLEHLQIGRASCRERVLVQV